MSTHDPTPEAVKPTRPWLGLIRRGETAIAPAGLALIAILAASLLASAWWAHRSSGATLAAARIAEVRAAGDVMAGACENLIGSRDLSPMRRLVMDTARHHELTACRVLLPDGQVLADADPSRITVTALPETWAPAAPDGPTIQQTPQAITLRYPLSVRGSGGATLEIEAGPRDLDAAWSMQAGIGAIGALSLVVLLLVYRHVRGRVRPLVAIGESLEAAHGGENATAALTVHPGLGRLAQAWNRLLEEREGKRVERVERELRAALGSRHWPGGDLADACNALSQGMALIDDQQRIIYVNGAAAVFLGHKRDALLGAPWSSLKLDSGVSDAVREAITGPNRRRQTLEIERTPGGGDGVLRFAIRPIHRGDAPAAVLVIDDITQQRVAEQSRNTFIAQATHELRMPLTNIRLYVETALEDGDEDAKLRSQCLNVINSESRRLEGLVSNMLSISEIEAGSLTLQTGDVRLDALFEELEADFRASAREKQIELSFALPPKLPVIQADRERLVIAMQNLVGNAIKYTPEAGKVEVIVEATATQLTVEVKDTGIGIGEADLPHVFDTFYRAEDKRVRDIAGSGLGLALSREVVRLHGGDITVESQTDRGTTFTINLPITVEAM